MKATVFAGAVLAVPLLGAVPQPAVSGTVPWLHVRVEEPDRKARVHVNLPLPVVEAALKAAPDAIGSDRHIHLGRDGVWLGAHHRLTVADLRRAWKELKAAGDTEFVSVEDEDETVRVSRRGELVQVRVNHEGKREEVHVDVPVALVDALLAVEGEGLDVRAGIAELRKLRGDVVRVRDRQTTVRVWIDETSGPLGGN